ncbi:MAG: DUF4175 domain-containing protein [Hyphomonadaceae bacterium]
MKHADALAQLARETKRARRALGVERIARAALWPLAAAGVWAIIALLGGQDALPPLAQSLAAIGALLAIGWLALRAARHFRWPNDAEARARLAADSSLDAGAFEALEDRPSRLDPSAIALWRVEQDRAIARAEHARARPARPRLDAADPRRLRFLILLAFVGAALFAGAAAPDRLARAFFPDPGPLLGDGPIAVEAWLTPADYTGAAPVSLSDRINERIDAPPSVEATVRVAGPAGAPALIFEGQRGHRERVLMRRTADGAYEAQIAIPHDGRLRVVRFHTRASWRINPGADRPPRAQLTAPIALLSDERATIAWDARDDYGVRSLALRITPVNPPEGLRGAAPIDTEIESPAGDPREAEDETEVALAEHPYAGMEVEVRLVARDALGQEGVSAPQRITLPEKVFLQPLARAAIEIRRMILWERRAYEPARIAPGGPATMAAGDILTGTERLIIRTDDQDPRLERSPAAIRRAAHFIDTLTVHPEDGYFQDRAVFLGFRYAFAALGEAREIGETDHAADILWRTALRAEYGGAADARRALDMAQQALADALANGASQERIQQLTEALRRAMDNYMQALVQEAMRRGNQQTQEDTQDQTTMTQRDLQQALDEIERLSREGNQAAAQALLQQLAALLANMEVQLSQGGQGQGEQGQEGEESELEQSMQELSEAMGEQRELNDQTQAQAEGGQGGEQGEGRALGERQGDIQDQVNSARAQAERGGAEDFQSLQNAERAMQSAEEALRRGDYESARASQDEAMRNLREGAASLAEQIAEERRNREGGQGREQAGERDPLGRAQGGMGENGETQVPTEADQARSRQILDELRRRAQDPRRPETERDYLRRLLDRFTGS